MSQFSQAIIERMRTRTQSQRSCIKRTQSASVVEQQPVVPPRVVVRRESMRRTHYRRWLELDAECRWLKRARRARGVKRPRYKFHRRGMGRI